jgi:molybdopterin converting factor small subunit
MVVRFSNQLQCLRIHGETPQEMKIKVRLFARARDLAGLESVELDIPNAGRVFDLKRSLAERFPQISPLISSLLVAVGTDYADDRTPLSSDVDVACFPPVSGG